MFGSAGRLFAPILLWTFFAGTAFGQSAGSGAPPSPEQYLGYALGQQFTPYAQIQGYSRALAEASPRVEYRSYGTTPERRELFQLVIATPENAGRLEEILAAHRELTDPETPAARSREIAARYPAVIYFSYGIHGSEASSSEAALWTAWDLARGDEEVEWVLDSLVVVMDPVANPDGRDRYVGWYRSVVGATPNASPAAREHREPWPSGRFNHYLFDLNRDWAWMTQPETRARLRSWARWNPVVHVDFHEMSHNSSYFFFPAAAPINPIYPEHILRWGKRFGEGNARVFDANGWAYFTGDSYDLFYPGYGDSWPSLLGAVGMTYEQAGGGAAGLAIEQSSGDVLTLLDRATHHWASGKATLRTAAGGKTQLLEDFAQAQRAVGQGEPDVLLVPGPDTLRLRALVRHLRAQGIQTERATRPFRASSTAYPGFDSRRAFPEGSYRVRARQPRGRLATTLLQPHTRLEAEYSYDISAWSLPYAYGVEAHQARGSVDAGWSGAEIYADPDVPVRAAGYGYLLPPGEASARGVLSLAQAGARVRLLSRATQMEGRSWPAGSWFVPVAGNDSLQLRLDRAGVSSLVVPVSSGRAESGMDLGSVHAWAVEAPRVAVLTGEGVVPTSFGAHWSYLEEQLALPFDAVLLGDLDRLDLGQYDVLVVPDLSGGGPGELAQEELRRWVEGGGRLVAVAGGAEAVAPAFDVKPRAPLLRDSTERASLLLNRAERVRRDWTEEVPGAILAARLDMTHPLAWGAGLQASEPTLFVLHQGTLVFEPAADAETVAYFPTELSAVSGVISQPNLERLEEGAWLLSKRVGRGSVVLFADDPLFRLFWKATHPLYLNALLAPNR